MHELLVSDLEGSSSRTAPDGVSGTETLEAVSKIEPVSLKSRKYGHVCTGPDDDRISHCRTLGRSELGFRLAKESRKELEFSGSARECDHRKPSVLAAWLRYHMVLLPAVLVTTT